MRKRCLMNEREEIIRLWFDMWIKQTGFEKNINPCS